MSAKCIDSTPIKDFAEERFYESLNNDKFIVGFASLCI